MVKCVRLGIELEGLDRAPFPGPTGQRIFDGVSKQAWQEWLQHQTMVINENRLTPFEPEAKKMLAEEREKFLFGGGAEKPEGYIAEK
jgi:Fe-S cluster biosynthesis and repair protein YggX